MTHHTDTYDPEAWRLVPKKATDEMKDAFKAAYSQGSFWNARIDHAMEALLAAAPTPPVSAQSVSTASATVQVDPSAAPLTLAPYANRKYRECDLPGQCKGEGRCHHPASGDRSAQSGGHRQGSEALGGYGHGFGACTCGAVPDYTTHPSAEGARTPEMWLLITEGAFGRTAMKATFDATEGQRWKDAGCTVREYYDPCKPEGRA